MNQEDLKPNHRQEALFDVVAPEPASGPCTACGGNHCYYWPGQASPNLDGIYEYICPTMGRPSKLRVMGATPENLLPSDWLPVRLAADTDGEEHGGRTKRQRGG